MAYLAGSNVDVENNVTNIVLTNIPTQYYDAEIYVQLVLVVEVDGVERTITDEIRTRTVINVAHAIANDVNESATARAYAQSVIDAFNSYNSVACLAYGKETV